METLYEQVSRKTQIPVKKLLIASDDGKIEMNCTAKDLVNTGEIKQLFGKQIFSFNIFLVSNLNVNKWNLYTIKKLTFIFKFVLFLKYFVIVSNTSFFK